MSKLRSRTVTISVKQDITSLIEQYGKYAWILHDKDTNKETGELIDPHYHIYLEFPNARSLDAVANELGIAPNFVEIVRDKKGILNYLTHNNNPEKYQYDISEVHSNFDIKTSTEVLTMMSVLDFVDTSETFSEFIVHLVKLGMTGNVVSNLCNCIKLWKMRRNGPL